jgi:hypothetical protein
MYAFLSLLLLPIAYFLINTIFSLNVPGDAGNRLIDYNISEQQPNTSEIFVKGKNLFRSKCASCHVLFKDMTGPDLIGFTERGPWKDRQNIYQWIRNPSGFAKKNQYARELMDSYNVQMTAFDGIGNKEIDAICEYIIEAEKISMERWYSGE